MRWLRLIAVLLAAASVATLLRQPEPPSSAPVTTGTSLNQPVWLQMPHVSLPIVASMVAAISHKNIIVGPGATAVIDFKAISRDPDAILQQFIDTVRAAGFEVVVAGDRITISKR